MFNKQLKKINEEILTLLHLASISDINRACVIYNVHLNVAQVIAVMQRDTLLKLSKNVNVLIQPSMIPLETWVNLETLDDHAIAAITFSQKSCHS